MTPEEMRVAIAGRSGWTWGVPHLATKMGLGGCEFWCREGDFRSEEDLPSYLHDRDAIADAVAHAASERGFPFQESYTRELRRIVTRRRRDLNEMQIDFWMAEADAAQRAEAFCRVFWPERFELPAAPAAVSP